MGLGLSRDLLRLSDEELEKQKNRGTLRFLSKTRKFGEILRGKESIGGMLQQMGFKSVPSPQFPYPSHDENYFNGGFIVRHHASFSDDSNFDSTQLEVTASVRETPEARKKFSAALAAVLNNFIKLYQQ